jgi:anaphase-promoting complex subunit 1
MHDAIVCDAAHVTHAGEHVVVPLLCLSGVVPSPAGDSGPNNGRVLVNLDLTNAQPAAGGGAAAEVTAWCEFHNGVAAGLKIVPCRSRRKQQRQQQQQSDGSVEDAGSGMASSRDGSGAGSLSDSWLPHSKPAVPNYAHAGVLLALGLHGHLDRLCWTDLYR